MMRNIYMKSPFDSRYFKAIIWQFLFDNTIYSSVFYGIILNIVPEQWSTVKIDVFFDKGVFSMYYKQFENRTFA
jgi:hypothetical protein